VKSGKNSNQSRSTPEVIPGAHNGIYCNMCKQSPIQGVRFKCTVRPNYDLCATCEAKDPERHPMIKMRVPERKDIHYNVACDMCNVSPIVGVRFKCTVRPNFDLCAKCEAKDPEEHPMIKMRVASRFSASRGRGRRGNGRGHGGRWRGGRWRGGRGFCGPRGRGRGNWRHFMRMMSQQSNVTADQKVTELPAGPLSFGACGPHVAYLQRVLIQLGHMDQSAIRWRAGFYGPRTTQAVSQVATAMRSENADELSGVFTDGIREHLLRQLCQVRAPAQSVSEPVSDEPVFDKPVSDEPVSDEPVADEPVADEPVSDEHEPVADEPVSDEPVAEPIAESAPVEHDVPQEDLASPFPVQLEVLRAMGFLDRDSIAALQRNGGNLGATVEWLLSH